MHAVERRGHEGELYGKCWFLAPPRPMSYLSWNCRGLGNP